MCCFHVCLDLCDGDEFVLGIYVRFFHKPLYYLPYTNRSCDSVTLGICMCTNNTRVSGIQYSGTSEQGTLRDNFCPS